MVLSMGPSSAVVNPMVPFVEPAEVDRSKEYIPGTARVEFEPDGERRQDVREFTQRWFQPMPPLVDTRRISKCSGYVIGRHRGM